MKKKIEKRITVDELARMTQHGFQDIRTDFKEHTSVVLDQFRLLNAEIKDIKTTLGPTMVIVAQQENKIQNLEFRLGRVERKVGVIV